MFFKNNVKWQKTVFSDEINKKSFAFRIQRIKKLPNILQISSPVTSNSINNSVFPWMFYVDFCVRALDDHSQFQAESVVVSQ
jgi:hypothetical protein